MDSWVGLAWWVQWGSTAVKASLSSQRLADQKLQVGGFKWLYTYISDLANSKNSSKSGREVNAVKTGVGPAWGWGTSVEIPCPVVFMLLFYFVAGDEGRGEYGDGGACINYYYHY